MIEYMQWSNEDYTFQIILSPFCTEYFNINNVFSFITELHTTPTYFQSKMSVFLLIIEYRSKSYFYGL